MTLERITDVFKRRVIYLLEADGFSHAEAEFAYDNAPASVFDDTTPEECAERIAAIWE